MTFRALRRKLIKSVKKRQRWAKRKKFASKATDRVFASWHSGKLSIGLGKPSFVAGTYHPQYATARDVRDMFLQVSSRVHCACSERRCGAEFDRVQT
mmetsp:Transcript_60979/g.144096  ORF Transcript_60979/g.144096 Transcript_60979/m.144096 type:complete len:97 (-) Transcript_60979:494-784(-)